MKHAFVSETLTSAERSAPFAVLKDDDGEPLPAKTRTLMCWDGPEWAEIDAETGGIIARGSTAAGDAQS